MNEERLAEYPALGHPVPEHRRDNAFAWLRSVGIARDRAWSIVEKMADSLSADRPHQAVEYGRLVVDLTGAYRLFDLLLTSEPVKVAA